MDNNELLSQIASMLENQTEEINQRLQSMNNKIDEQSRDLKVYIENRVEQRIDALFNGYKLNREKQWELEEKYDSLNDKVETLQSEFYSLKKKVG